jgi:hypothetical protein
MKRSDDEVLSGWDEIASYLRVGVRTAQRKERNQHLPIRRAKGGGPKEPVIALKSELDHWRFGSQASAENRPSQRPQLALPQAAELALPALKYIFSMEEVTKLYRRDYFMRFDLRPSRTGVYAHVEYRYELCNASNERQPFVQEVTVDDSDHGYVETMALSAGKRTIYILRKPPVAQRYIGWVAHRGPEQWIEPRIEQGKYLCRASWVIQRAANDIWYNHMILPTLGLKIETHAPAAYEITPSIAENRLVMKGEHRDIAWHRRTAP